MCAGAQQLVSYCPAAESSDRLAVMCLQVTVDRPDVQGRVRILKVHSRGKQIGKDVDFEKIARRTPGKRFQNSSVGVLLMSYDASPVL